MSLLANTVFRRGDRVTWQEGGETIRGTVVHVQPIPLGRDIVTAQGDGRGWLTTDTAARFRLDNAEQTQE
jgi:hypothetical protein